MMGPPCLKLRNTFNANLSVIKADDGLEHEIDDFENLDTLSSLKDDNAKPRNYIFTSFILHKSYLKKFVQKLTNFAHKIIKAY